MHLSAAQWFWIFGTLALQITILALMTRRGFRATFPFFFNFLAFSLVTGILQAAALPRLSPMAYFYTYWSVTAGQTLLSFAVIYEVFVHILKPYQALMDLGKLLFRWVFVFLALVSVLTALATTGSQASKICGAILLLGRTSELMQCGILLLFLLLESRLGVSWRSPAACILLGFCGNSAFSLISSFVGEHVPNWSYTLEVTGSIVCVIVYAAWCASFALPQPRRSTAQDAPTRLILQRWNEALLASPLVGRRGEVIAMTPVESFLPGVERTVERVMARKMMN